VVVVVIAAASVEARPPGHVLDTERLRIIGMDQLEHPNDAGEVVIPAGQEMSS
jgi:hypothetical protein